MISEFIKIKKMIIKKHLIISGKVQGVGFRYWMKNLAINNDISGWVKNKFSGDVEALIIGQEKEVQKLLKQCKIGPCSANIQNIQINDHDQDYLKEGFNIL
jgi:acylphosphatase|tara:strand:+ start:285 stop:587 length:303 start_codon:yes stop_codon:yes gene_type:complete